VTANNTLDASTLAKRAQAMKIIYYGFDDTDLDTVITTGTANGFTDGIAYSTSTPTAV
jgi:hypothetical protein